MGYNILMGCNKLWCENHSRVFLLTAMPARMTGFLFSFFFFFFVNEMFVVFFLFNNLHTLNSVTASNKTEWMLGKSRNLCTTVFFLSPAFVDRAEEVGEKKRKKEKIFSSFLCFVSWKQPKRKWIFKMKMFSFDFIVKRAKCAHIAAMGKDASISAI